MHTIHPGEFNGDAATITPPELAPQAGDTTETLLAKIVAAQAAAAPSTGGNGAADALKPAQYDANGDLAARQLRLGQSEVADGALLLEHSGHEHTATFSASPDMTGNEDYRLPDNGGTLTTREWDIGAVRCHMRDDFVNGGTTGGTIGETGWASNGLTVTYRGHETNHPGIIRLTATSGTTGSIYPNYSAGTGMAPFNGLTLEFVFRLDSITGVQAAAGLAYVNSYLTNGGRVIHFDPALSANWRLLHYTQAGATTYVDTGKAAVVNDWVKVKLFFNGATTTCTICTTSSPAEATVSNSGADTHSTLAHTVQITNKATGATKNLDVDLVLISAPVLTRL